MASFKTMLLRQFPFSESCCLDLDFLFAFIYQMQLLLLRVGCLVHLATWWGTRSCHATVREWTAGRNSAWILQREEFFFGTNHFPLTGSFFVIAHTDFQEVMLLRRAFLTSSSSFQIFSICLEEMCVIHLMETYHLCLVVSFLLVSPDVALTGEERGLIWKCVTLTGQSGQMWRPKCRDLFMKKKKKHTVIADSISQNPSVVLLLTTIL